MDGLGRIEILRRQPLQAKRSTGKGFMIRIDARIDHADGDPDPAGIGAIDKLRPVKDLPRGAFYALAAF